jgi:hypothetical protein
VLREKLARAEYALFEHITVCGRPDCGMKHTRGVSTAVAASLARILRLDMPTVGEVLSWEDLPDPRPLFNVAGLLLVKR